MSGCSPTEAKPPKVLTLLLPGHTLREASSLKQLPELLHRRTDGLVQGPRDVFTRRKDIFRSIAKVSLHLLRHCLVNINACRSFASPASQFHGPVDLEMGLEIPSCSPSPKPVRGQRGRWNTCHIYQPAQLFSKFLRPELKFCPLVAPKTQRSAAPARPLDR